MRLAEYVEVGQASSRTELLDKLLRVANGMEFPYANIVLVTSETPGQTSFQVVSNLPAEFSDGRDPKLAIVDPLMSRLRRTCLPCIYDQGFYVNAGAANLWEVGASYGYRTGIAAALRISSSQQLVMGMDRADKLPTSEKVAARMLADLQLLAAHCVDPVLRLLTRPHSATPTAYKLTVRELDALRWTLEGKTAEEVGQILAIGTRTANKHIQSATLKLDAVNKHAAALKAMRLGLV